MAQDQQSRTEAPSQRRRDDARKKGDFALSRDLVAGFGLLGAVLVFYVSGDEMAATLTRMVRSELASAPLREISTAHVISLTRTISATLFKCVGGLVLGLAFFHTLVSLLQTGFFITLEPLSPNWSRLNPINGVKQIFSTAALNRGAQAVIKTTILVTVIVMAARSQRSQIALVAMQPLPVIVALAWNIALRSSFFVGLALVAAGGLDYAFQKWKHENQLKMTREEVKEENKQDEGDPLLRARIRRVQRDLAKQRMLRDVPSATVVVTNPTHYAIAMKYELGQAEAPRVVAKGTDAVALHIRRIAERHDVPILERPALARSLYRVVEVGDEIPPELYLAVSEIITYLYKSGKFR